MKRWKLGKRREIFVRTRCGYSVWLFNEDTKYGLVKGILYAGTPQNEGCNMTWNTNGRLWIFYDSPYDIVGPWNKRKKRK